MTPPASLDERRDAALRRCDEQIWAEALKSERVRYETRRPCTGPSWTTTRPRAGFVRRIEEIR